MSTRRDVAVVRRRVAGAEGLRERPHRRAAASLHVAGQIGWDDAAACSARGDLVAQFAQALDNVLAVVRAAGGAPRTSRR